MGFGQTARGKYWQRRRLNSGTDAATCVCGPRHMSTIWWVRYSDCIHDIMLTMIGVRDMDMQYMTLCLLCGTVNTSVDRKELSFWKREWYRLRGGSSPFYFPLHHRCRSNNKAELTALTNWPVKTKSELRPRAVCLIWICCDFPQSIWLL